MLVLCFLGCVAAMIEGPDRQPVTFTESIMDGIGIVNVSEITFNRKSTRSEDCHKIKTCYECVQVKKGSQLNSRKKMCVYNAVTDECNDYRLANPDARIDESDGSGLSSTTHFVRIVKLQVGIVNAESDSKLRGLVKRKFWVQDLDSCSVLEKKQNCY